MTAAPVRLRRGGPREQATVAAGAVVGVAMLVGTLAQLLLLQSSLTSTLRSSTAAVVSQDARTLAVDGLGSLTEVGTDRSTDNVLVQVLAPPSRAGGPPRRRYAGTGSDGSERAAAAADPLGTSPTVSSWPRASSWTAPRWWWWRGWRRRTARGGGAHHRLLLVGRTPLLALLAAWVTWWRVGRALRSVDLITSQVEHIGAAHLTQRVRFPRRATRSRTWRRR